MSDNQVQSIALRQNIALIKLYSDICNNLFTSTKFKTSGIAFDMVLMQFCA